MLKKDFFDCDAQILARKLLGKIIRHFFKNVWISARIIETEAYYLREKGSHASLGFTRKRKALFMEAGTIYMYYARGKDSLNVSAAGPGNAVLIKSAIPWFDDISPQTLLPLLQQNHPRGKKGEPRSWKKLCCGQTLLCKTLGLKVKDWDAQNFVPERFFFEARGLFLQEVIQTTRLGIPKGRDEHLPYRFIDKKYAKFCTKNPLTMKNPPPLTLH